MSEIDPRKADYLGTLDREYFKTPNWLLEGGWDYSIVIVLQIIIAKQISPGPRGKGWAVSVNNLSANTGRDKRTIKRILQILIERKVLIPDGRGKYGVQLYKIAPHDLWPRELKWCRGTPVSKNKGVLGNTTKTVSGNTTSEAKGVLGNTTIKNREKKKRKKNPSLSFSDDVPKAVGVYYEAAGMPSYRFPKEPKAELITDAERVVEATGGDMELVAKAASNYVLDSAKPSFHWFAQGIDDWLTRKPKLRLIEDDDIPCLN